MKPLAEIADEDHEVMTSEEYQVSLARIPLRYTLTC